MTGVLKNFVTIRKNRGDILSPATFRSTVEMIKGILKKYDYSGFNDTYQSFLAHLENHKDPHKVTEFGFYEEIITSTYTIYSKMTATPVSEAEFRSAIVPSLGFLELIRRIVLNRYIYLSVRNPNGSVPETAMVYLTKDWGRNKVDNEAVEISFGSPLANEDEFLALGWGSNTTPIPIIFNADHILLEPIPKITIFHTSIASPYFPADNSSSVYQFSLTSSSNDFLIEILTSGVPSSSTNLVSLTNGTDVFHISLDENMDITLYLNNTIIASTVTCGCGKVSVMIRKDGTIHLTTFENSIPTENIYSVDFSNVSPFVSGSISAPIEEYFNKTFGITELSVHKLLAI